MYRLNCDIGERGAKHLIDDALMKVIDVANIACGGHAGDKESVHHYMALARKHKVKVTAHISYPDKENFGRETMDIGVRDLTVAMNRQLSLIKSYKPSHIDTVKFHGALYNDSVKDKSIAMVLACWMADKRIKYVVTNADGKLADACRTMGVEVIAEFFAERNYIKDSQGNIALAPRNLDFASIHDVKEAFGHTKNIMMFDRLFAYVEYEDNKYTQINTPIDKNHFTGMDGTICIHSDSEIALELATKIKDRLILKSA